MKKQQKKYHGQLPDDPMAKHSKYRLFNSWFHCIKDLGEKKPYKNDIYPTGIQNIQHPILSRSVFQSSKFLVICSVDSDIDIEIGWGHGQKLVVQPKQISTDARIIIVSFYQCSPSFEAEFIIRSNR